MKIPKSLQFQCFLSLFAIINRYIITEKIMKIYIIRHGETDANKEGQLHHAETNDKSSFHLRTLLFSDTVNIKKRRKTQ